MKTMAIRLDDVVSAQLTALAQLEDSSVTELIREAIELLIQHKRDQGDLAARAEAARADIDREAVARKGAIEALFGALAEEANPQAPAGPPAKRSRTRRNQEPTD